MANYCVNREEQDNGDHEVHQEGCRFWPRPQNVQPLGWHSDCTSAVREAKRHFNQVNGCRTCSYPCHTQ